MLKIYLKEKREIFEKYLQEKKTETGSHVYDSRYI